MSTARFCTGMVILAGFAMVILIVIPGRQAAPSGPVEGSVAFDGRPLAGGMIFFSSEDPEDGEGVSAKIDRNGHFECDPRWRRDRAARMRFRIDILLAPQNFAPYPPRDYPGEIPAQQVWLGPEPAHLDIDLSD